MEMPKSTPAKGQYEPDDIPGFDARAARQARSESDPVFVFVETGFDAHNWTPRVVSVRDLEKRMADDVYGLDPGPFRLYWFAADGEAIEVRVEGTGHGGADEDDIADYQWAVVTPRGTVLAELAARIDERA